MWKYLAALMLLLTIGVVGAQDQIEVCDVCYANIITQSDTQTIENVKIGMSNAEPHNDKVGIGNEGLSAAIIVTPAPMNTTNSMFATAGFARIDQVMKQTINGLGTADPMLGEEAAKGLTWNKAIQAAWIANQGIKELEMDENGAPMWVKEGAYIAQYTNQTTYNIYDYDSREEAKILNLDNKVAMIVDDLNTIINLTGRANTASIDSQTSIGNITNDVNVTVRAIDP